MSALRSPSVAVVLGTALVAPLITLLALALRPEAASLALDPNSELLEDRASAAAVAGQQANTRLVA